MSERMRSAAAMVLLVYELVGPAAFEALIRNELAKWGRVIKKAGVKID